MEGNSTEQLADFRMTRVTFGVSSSPFLATRALQQVASDSSEQFPEAASAIRSAFYVDDCITGASTIKQAMNLQTQLQELLSSHDLILRKWRSSSQEVLANIPDELHEQAPTADVWKA